MYNHQKPKEERTYWVYKHRPKHKYVFGTTNPRWTSEKFKVIGYNNAIKLRNDLNAKIDNEV